MAKRSPTTKDIGLLYQLHSSGQLSLAPEFQRNAVWPTRAKAYLIDTILNDRPIPLLFFQRTASAQKGGLPGYTVIDGQQRLRAIFEFIDDRYRLTQSSKRAPFFKKRFSQLSNANQDLIRNYDLVVEELSGYSDDDIRDMFVRFNKYVVKLVSQELRHAKGAGKFHDFAEECGSLDFWRANKVFSVSNIRRMRPVEFAAELTILLIEGPQDKKASVDLYYQEYEKRFPDAKQVRQRLEAYLDWISRAIPALSKSRYRKPVDLYSLIGALHNVSNHGARLSKIKHADAGKRLLDFEREMQAKSPTGDAARYLVAASRQTDNLIPRNTRIQILEAMLKR